MDCLFCKIANHKIPAKIVYEDEELIAFDDIAPKAPVHILVIPKKHIDSVTDLKEEDAPLAGRLLIKAAEIAKNKGIVDSGFRIIFNTGKHSGQEVDHIHLHLLGGKPLGSMVCE